MHRQRFRPLLLLLMLSTSLAADGGEQPSWGPAGLSGLVTDPALDEISGMAVSRLHPGTIWVHNDSGDGPVIHAMSTRGTRIASVTVAGVKNVDWEDMAGFELDGRRYLLIADTGDNGGIRETLLLHVIAEPDRLEDHSVRPAWSIEFRWPDGPRDCEAVAVDPVRGEILLIGKKRVPPDLFRLSLRPDSDGLQVAERLGTLAGVIQPTDQDLQRNPRFGRYHSQISGADLSEDGRWLAVLNYRTAYVYGRAPDQDWGAAAAGAPIQAPYPWLPQAEAIGFDADGDLWIGGEKRLTPLLRLPLKR